MGEGTTATRSRARWAALVAAVALTAGAGCFRTPPTPEEQAARIDEAIQVTVDTYRGFTTIDAPRAGHRDREADYSTISTLHGELYGDERDSHVLAVLVKARGRPLFTEATDSDGKTLELVDSRGRVSGFSPFRMSVSFTGTVAVVLPEQYLVDHREAGLDIQLAGTIVAVAKVPALTVDRYLARVERIRAQVKGG